MQSCSCETCFKTNAKIQKYLKSKAILLKNILLLKTPLYK